MIEMKKYKKLTYRELEVYKSEFEEVFNNCGYYQEDNFETLWTWIEDLVDQIEDEVVK